MKRLFTLSLLFILCFTNLHSREIIAENVNDLIYHIGELQSNDTILIADGTYNLTTTLVINNKTEKIYDVCIKSRSGNRDGVVLLCPGMGQYSGQAPHVFNIFNVEHLVIADLTAGETYWHPITVSGNSGAEAPVFRNLRLFNAGEQFIKINNGEENKCDNGLIEDCLIEYTDYAYWDGDKYYTQGIDKIGGGDGWTIRGCTIKNIRPHPEHVGQAGGCGAAITFWQGGSDNIIERNTIINCRKGIELGIGSDGGINGGIVRNNFVYRAEGEIGGDMGILVNSTPNARVLNNTVILNGTFDPGNGPKTIEYRFELTTGLYIKNNLCDGDIWHRTDGLNPDISHNISDAESTWFVNATEVDLHLLENATEAIDMGTALDAVTDDIDGDSRPFNDTWDIGADEYVSESAVESPEQNNTIVNCYPMPADGIIHFEIQVSEACRHRLAIFNSNGAKVFSGSYLPGSHNRIIASIKTDNFIPGVYYFILEGNEVKVSGKFVKF